MLVDTGLWVGVAGIAALMLESTEGAVALFVCAALLIGWAS
jgi:hypothetical protein